MITVSQVAAIFRELLRKPRPSYAEVARVVNEVLSRSEQSRIYAHYKRTGRIPPPRAPNITLYDQAS